MVQEGGNRQPCESNTMQQVPTSNPDELWYRQPLWHWLLVLFVPVSFGLVGFGCWWLLSIAWAMYDREQQLLLPLVLATLSVFLFVWFVNRMFGRIGCRVNRVERTLTKEWGIFWLPWTKRTFQIEDGDEVHVCRYLRHGVSPTQFYRCELRRNTGRRVTIGVNDFDETPTLAMAAALADALRIRAFNATVDPPKPIFADKQR